MIFLLPAILAIVLARPPADGGWRVRLAMSDAVLALAVLSEVAGDRSRLLAVAWLSVEAAWFSWRSLHEPRRRIRRGGGVVVILALLLAGGAMRMMQAVRGATVPVDAAVAILVAGLVGSLAADTPEGRLGALLVADGGLLQAGWGMPGVGPWGAVPALLARGVLVGLLERGAPRGPVRGRSG